MDTFFNQTVTLLKDEHKKGSWTYIFIPLENVRAGGRFGVRKVNGSIDGFELKDFTMWTMKNRGHFLAVKADIRKKIGKEAGDSVKLVLFLDEPPEVAADDLIVCLKEEPQLYRKFMALDAKKRNEITKWVFAAQTDDAKVQRIARVLEGLESGKPILPRV
jgi:hypothetical protein